MGVNAFIRISGLKDPLKDLHFAIFKQTDHLTLDIQLVSLDEFIDRIGYVSKGVFDPDLIVFRVLIIFHDLLVSVVEVTDGLHESWSCLLLLNMLKDRDFRSTTYFKGQVIMLEFL